MCELSMMTILMPIFLLTLYPLFLIPIIIGVALYDILVSAAIN